MPVSKKQAKSSAEFPRLVSKTKLSAVRNILKSTPCPLNVDAYKYHQSLLLRLNPRPYLCHA